jgi:hypothetical protein
VFDPFRGTKRLVLVFIDFLALTILFPIELALIRLRQVSVVRRHIPLLVILEPLLAFFQIGGLAGRQFVVLDSIRYPVLLILFPVVDLVHARMIRIYDPRTGARCVRIRLRNRRPGQQQTTCQDRQKLAGLVFHVSTHLRESVVLEALFS